ncbi:uncharacterized protein LOC130266154 isoform X2 [Oenanthe melanoleuca]|uniref:uncharacterized protein LOC130266154 isoform X2 n=1 Tax=Oenanthe melanoleuca TaxID=2939378 RepID=UPI0024C15ECE|nr:uncharacterized protein LOC130266154 isoform X2 [Oenanthe melanoleuca]
MDFVDLLLLTKDEDGHTLLDEDIAAEADTFMFEGEQELPGATGAEPLQCPLTHLMSPQATTLRPVAWHGSSITWLATLSTRSAATKRSRSSWPARTLQTLNDEMSPGPPLAVWLGNMVPLLLVPREDLSQLPFTTMCIKESLRLHPPVTAMSQCCTEDVPLRDGRVIPKEGHSEATPAPQARADPASRGRDLAAAGATGGSGLRDMGHQNMGTSRQAGVTPRGGAGNQRWREGDSIVVVVGLFCPWSWNTSWPGCVHPWTSPLGHLSPSMAIHLHVTIHGHIPPCHHLCL